MHGGHPFFIVIAAEILATTAALYFLAKAKQESLGGGFKWAGRILVIVGFIAMASTITFGIVRMCHHRHHSYHWTNSARLWDERVRGYEMDHRNAAGTDTSECNHACCKPDADSPKDVKKDSVKVKGK